MLETLYHHIVFVTKYIVCIFQVLHDASELRSVQSVANMSAREGLYLVIVPPGFVRVMFSSLIVVTSIQSCPQPGRCALRLLSRISTNIVGKSIVLLVRVFQ